MRQKIWSQLSCLFAFYIVILLAQEQDHAHNTQELLDEHDYQMCGVENKEMAMIHESLLRAIQRKEKMFIPQEVSNMIHR